MRRFIAPAISSVRAERARDAQIMVRLDRIVAEFAPNGGSSIVDRLRRIESLAIAAAEDIAFLQPSIDFLFAQGKHAVWRSDATGAVVYMSEEFEALTGIETYRLLGRNWEQTVFPDDLDRMRSEWQRAVSQGCDFALKYRVSHASGSVFWVQAKARPIYAGASVTGYLGSVRRCADPRIEAT